MGKTVSAINCTNIFLGYFSKAIEMKAKISKWDLITLIRFARQRKPETK